jgi:opacity protein-like surface antigen
MMRGSLSSLLLLIAAAPAMAQSSASATSDGRADAPTITPKNGQSPQQLWTDRYECYQWAVSQSGFDPNRAAGTVSGGDSGAAQYRRAFGACIEGRGYTIRYGAPAAAPPAPPPAPVYSRPGPAIYAGTLVPVAPQIKYQPLEFHIDGGYSVTSGATGNTLDDGSNAGLGLTWFPTSAIPVGLRVDGSYSWFHIRNSALDASGSGYTHGDENIYGGDADLQFDLAHRSSLYKFYLFGGAGRYRAETDVRTVQLEPGVGCGFYFCSPGLFPIETARDRSTSPWLNSWNAGLGFETAVADNAQFFIEARYLRIGPQTDKMQFVPIRLGFRF